MIWAVVLIKDRKASLLASDEQPHVGSLGKTVIARKTQAVQHVMWHSVDGRWHFYEWNARDRQVVKEIKKSTLRINPTEILTFKATLWDSCSCLTTEDYQNLSNHFLCTCTDLLPTVCGHIFLTRIMRKWRLFLADHKICPHHSPLLQQHELSLQPPLLCKLQRAWRTLKKEQAMQVAAFLTVIGCFSHALAILIFKACSLE